MGFGILTGTKRRTKTDLSNTPLIAIPQGMAIFYYKVCYNTFITNKPHTYMSSLEGIPSTENLAEKKNIRREMCKNKYEQYITSARNEGDETRYTVSLYINDDMEHPVLNISPEGSNIGYMINITDSFASHLPDTKILEDELVEIFGTETAELSFEELDAKMQQLFAHE